MRVTTRQIGLAAVILLAPGGFILGVTLAASHWRKRTAILPGDTAPGDSGSHGNAGIVS